jgi:hypothetical protein
MKYVVEMGSGVMIYIRNFIKIGSGIRRLRGGIHRHTDSLEIASYYFYFFQNKERMQKKNGIGFHRFAYITLTQFVY